MRLNKARVQNYRSIIDSGEFNIEDLKTILVGPNEAGKTALLQAIQYINPPKEIKKLYALRDYPRSLYSRISRGEIKENEIVVVKGTFILEPKDMAHAPDRFKGKTLTYELTRKIDNSCSHTVPGLTVSYYKDIKNDLLRLAHHLDRGTAEGQENKQTAVLESITSGWSDYRKLDKDTEKLSEWLKNSYVEIDEENEKENQRWEKINQEMIYSTQHEEFYKYLYQNMPTFVLYSNYFRVKPIIHLENLAKRTNEKVLDDEAYDYGNNCLLKLLGFSASELSELGKVTEINHKTSDIDNFREKLDQRSYQLNSASVELTAQIIRIWNPDEKKSEASKLQIRADGQYLKVVVEDDIGVEIELDQRSEGFQWLVSFFIVFFAESQGKHQNTILLLDEPGVSLHALKQREFRRTISLLADHNQTIYSTHSPFMVGPDELDLVRIVELTDRRVGTKVHTTITSSDPAAMLPLQEALGYDLAQSLFSNQRNMILEGLTDYWYLDACSGLMKAAGNGGLNDKIALVPANSASKIIYFATILSAHNLKVAALLDSDNAGDQAANQEVLIHKLSAKNIIRTGDCIKPSLMKAEIEDMVSNTLVIIAKENLGWDITAESEKSTDKPIIEIFKSKIGKEFSKYKLAKAFLAWSREHNFDDLEDDEKQNIINLTNTINSALK
ncbi:ATP-dependent OLD family endonuclease [Pantoea rodasii]|uniref:ATP-dependent OLD family endonuclease n=1 Tax=Pantoea rodasii TaxID=1076549 RepID=A0A0B1QZ94_9GAMM|nr:AAA family ATPase [Pantoea rodasii]KHJ65679.1 ATP-dependent OLD family endonuclease [Pantoea rodasii]